MHVLLNIELGSINGSKIGAHCLALVRKLVFLFGYVFSLRSIELVCLSSTSCRWPPSPVEEDHLNTIRFGYKAEFFFCFIYTPIGHKVSPIFSAIRKAQHNCLIITPFLDMFSINRVLVQFLHDARRIVQVIDRFKKRYDIDRQVIPLPSTQQEKSIYFYDVQRCSTVANDISITT